MIQQFKCGPEAHFTKNQLPFYQNIKDGTVEIIPRGNNAKSFIHDFKPVGFQVGKPIEAVSIDYIHLLKTLPKNYEPLTPDMNKILNFTPNLSK